MLLDDLAARVESEGIAVLGGDLFTARMPEEPDDCIAILEYEGGPPSFVQDSGVPTYEDPRARIEARSRDYDWARDKAEEVWLALGAVSNEVVGAARYLRVTPLQSPFVLEVDDNERTVVGFIVSARKVPG